jgi:hypothetical protein
MGNQGALKIKPRVNNMRASTIAEWPVAPGAAVVTARYIAGMPSKALRSWRSERRRRLDELMAAHQTVGGTGRGRRWRTRELNWALTLRLAGEFQGFARDLHNLAIDFFVAAASAGNADLAEVLQERVTTNRLLERGNAQPGSLGSDFALLGLTLWPTLTRTDARAPTWNDSLDRLNRTRNAIAHVDEDALEALRREGHPVTLKAVRRWTRDLDGLAATMDDVVSVYLDQLLGQGRPW